MRSAKDCVICASSVVARDVATSIQQAYEVGLSNGFAICRALDARGSKLTSVPLCVEHTVLVAASQAILEKQSSPQE